MAGNSLIPVPRKPDIGVFIAQLNDRNTIARECVGNSETIVTCFAVQAAVRAIWCAHFNRTFATW